MNANRPFFLISLLSLLLLEVVSQPSLIPVATAYQWPAASPGMPANVFASRNNPAALAVVKGPALAIYGERRYLLAQLGMYAVSLAIKKGPGSFALHGQYFGNALHHQAGLSLAYGRKLTEKVDLGLQFNYNSLVQGNGYGKARNVNAGIGAVFHVSKSVNVSLNIYNPGGSKWSRMKDDTIPSRYSMSISYGTSGKLLLSGEISKEENKPPAFTAGLQYFFATKLYARIGIGGGAPLWFGAVGCHLKSYSVELIASVHPQLGVSPGILIFFGSKGKKGATTELAATV